MSLELFWLEAPTSGSREVDPLGFGTVHEAASNRVLPYLTERTRHADDYLNTLAGLRWASARGGSDGECWRLFERFEKGLKLQWVYLLNRESGFRGVQSVVQRKRERRVDLRFELISQQRSQGLLGMYLTSLRAMRLVEPDRLAPTTAGMTLLDQTRFSWDGEAGSTVKWLHVFDGLTFTRGQRKQLGARLFSNPDMIEVARAVRRYGFRPHWRRAERHLRGDARAVASHAASFGRLADTALAAFHGLLANPTSRPRLRSAPAFGSAWWNAVFKGGLLRLADPFGIFVRSIARRGAPALVGLHEDIWKQRGHKTPWLRADGSGGFIVRRDAKWKVPPNSTWDHRWGVCHDLIRQTDWAGT